LSAVAIATAIKPFLANGSCIGVFVGDEVTLSPSVCLSWEIFCPKPVLGNVFAIQMETQNEAGFLQVVSSHGVPFHNYSAVVSRLRQLVGPDAILFANEGVDLWDWDQVRKRQLFFVWK
jgi:hypothetical protein